MTYTQQYYSYDLRENNSNVIAVDDPNNVIELHTSLQRQSQRSPRDMSELSNDYYARRNTSNRKEDEDEADDAELGAEPVEVKELSEESTSNDDTSNESSSGGAGIKKPGGMNQPFSKPCSRYFILTLSSNCLFVLASCFYLAMAGRELDYTIQIQDLSDDVTTAIDDYTWTMYAPFVTDDYIFETSKGVWISYYQILYFCGAMCFVFSGLVDVIKDGPNWLGIVLVLAGCFGLSSAMLVEKNVHLSNVFNSVSVHLFLLEALGLFFQRGAAGAIFANNPQLQAYVRLGDSFWIFGSFIDVVLSYYYVFETQELIHSQMAVFASTMWLACSLIYITATSHVECQGRKLYKLDIMQQQAMDGGDNNKSSSLQGNPTLAETPGGNGRVDSSGFNYMYDNDNKV